MTAPDRTIGFATLQRLFGPEKAARGSGYARDGRVLAVEVSPDGGHLQARVRGNKRIYEQDTVLTWSSEGELTAVKGFCHCPISFNCKHVVAALVQANAQKAFSAHASDPLPVAMPLKPLMPSTKQTPLAPPTAATLSGPLNVWMMQRPKEASDPKAQASSSTRLVRPAKTGIFYVLDRDLQHVTVKTIKAGVNKDGAIGRTRHDYNFASVSAHLELAAAFILPEDLRIFRWLKVAQLSSANNRVALHSHEDCEMLMRLLLQTGRTYWQTLDGPRLTEGEPLEGRFVWRAQNDQQKLSVQTTDGTWVEALPIDPCWYIDTTTGQCGLLTTDQPASHARWLANAPAVPAAQVNALHQAIQATGLNVPKPTALTQTVIRGVKPRPVLTLTTVAVRPRYSMGWYQSHLPGLAPNEMAPALRVSYDYGEHQVPGFPDQAQNDHRHDLTTVVSDNHIWQIERDTVAEMGPLIELTELAGDFDFWPTGTYEEELKVSDADEIDLILWPFDRHNPMDEGAGGEQLLGVVEHLVPLMRSRGWRVEIDPSWPIQLHQGTPQISGRVRESDEGWFSMGLSYVVDGHEFELLPVLVRLLNRLPPEALTDDAALDAALEHARHVVRLKDGLYAILPLAPLAPVVRVLRDMESQMHLAQAGLIPDMADALEGCGIPFEGGQALIDLGKQLRQLASPRDLPALPDSFKGQLRPYQHTGMAWMLALAETGFGGVLADDMGLGKTVQTLAYLAARKQHAEQATPSTAAAPALLIVPTSLVSNWVREAQRFVPSLSVLALHGTDRKADFDRIAEHDLVITTYPLLHRDSNVLFEEQYDTVILDEAQNVKNPTSQVAKLIREIKANHRLALTGTPMENNLQELWSLFDWLIPGLLGNRKRFNEQFRRPIEKEGNLGRQTQLTKRISPFLLRRTKDQVVTDLPPRTEMVETVPLEGAQRALYETLRVAMDQRVREALAKNGLAGSKITVLDALLKLRQACCDPKLVKLPSAATVNVSAKRRRLIEMLESLFAEGRRVLVFSQFVEMLRLIEADVKARGWDYLWLTGETKDRGSVVDAFQSGQAPLFLISLKAGGVGLTLTAADTVILYDPWWNPAIERQAMDRAHRIGQDKPVFVHRLIAEGTVETRIAQMQARKQALTDALFDPKTTGALTLSEEDILSLFAPIRD